MEDITKKTRSVRGEATQKTWNNVLFLGLKYEELSLIRGDFPSFTGEGFFDFAKKYEKRYKLVSEKSHLFVRFDEVDNLLSDYFKYLGIKKL